MTTRRRPRHIEDDHQEALYSWAQRYRLPEAPDIEPGAFLSDYLHAIPNGGRRDAREAARMKRQGVLAGVYDNHLPIGRAGFLGMYIELKIKPNKPTKNQLTFGDRVLRAGYYALICYDWLDAKHAIIEYLNHPPTTRGS